MIGVVKARQLCPNGIYLRVDGQKYGEVSRQIKELVLKISANVEFIALDEGYIDITDIIDKYPSHLEFAKRFKKGIFKHTGLTCSIGIGYNKLSAKLASEAKKPGGITLFSDNNIFSDYISDKGVKLIPGIGKKTQEILKAKGIVLISDVLSLSLREIRNILGYNKGDMLYERSRGIDSRRVAIQSKTHSIGNESTYSLPLEDKEVISEKLKKMYIGVHKRLIKSGYRAKTITIKVRYKDRITITRSKSLAVHTKKYSELEKTFQEILQELNFNKGVKLLGVTLGNLTKNKMYQLAFKKVDEIQREKNILDLKDKIVKF